MRGQYRWVPGAASTAPDVVVRSEPEWPTEDLDTVVRFGTADCPSQPPRLSSQRPPVPPSTVPYHVGGIPDRDGRQPTARRGGDRHPAASGRGPTHRASIMITLARNPQGQTVVIGRRALPPAGRTRPPAPGGSPATAGRWLKPPTLIHPAPSVPPPTTAHPSDVR